MVRGSRATTIKGDLARFSALANCASIRDIRIAPTCIAQHYFGKAFVVSLLVN